jgi:pimeloyl-ACP methyl ester carboxylesterase
VRIARVWSEVKAMSGSMPFSAKQPAGGAGLVLALGGQVDIPPAGEAVFKVPLALAVADAGWRAVAIDLRGFGRSDTNG